LVNSANDSDRRIDSSEPDAGAPFGFVGSVLAASVGTTVDPVALRSASSGIRHDERDGE
jgi:hypothetical protein